MKLYKALKKRARLKGEINDLSRRLHKCNCELEGNEYREKFDTLFTEYCQKVTELTNLKVRIMKANVDGGAFLKVTKLGELKDQLSLFQSLEVKEGKVARSGYANTDVLTYKSQVGTTKKISEVKRLTAEVEKLTDELDEFNATTDLPE